jgi:hypothetical protein
LFVLEIVKFNTTPGYPEETNSVKALVESEELVDVELLVYQIDTLFDPASIKLENPAL